MYLRKLKPSKGIGDLWIPLVILVFFILFMTFINAKIGFAFVILVFFMLSQFYLYFYYRTRSINYLFSGLFQIFFCGFIAFVPHVGVLGQNKAIAFMSLFVSVVFIFLAMGRQITGNNTWRGSDLFEQAARNINEATNGFTSRPHPFGKFEYRREEIISFVNWLQSKLVGIVVIDDSKIYFVPVKQGREYSMIFRTGYSLLESSWIAFNDNGDVNIHISKADYLDFKETLPFDQLCRSMGETCMEFLDFYRKGEEVRIIDRLNSMRRGIFN